MRSLLSVALIALPAATFAHHDQHWRYRAVALAQQDELDRRARGDPYPTGPGYDTPPLESITALSDGSPMEPTVPLPEVFNPGATNTLVNSPPLPTAAIDPSKWPALYAVPDVNSPEVQAWMKELEGHNIPNLSPTLNDAACGENPQIPDAERGASGRCWWTCGGCTRETDITTCSDKMNWGLTFDDGPAFYTPKLLTYLESKSLLATFYLVGSNVISRPEMVQTEYMTGHELSIHTWSHTALTTLSNAQVVAELGWTRKAIKDVAGVTPRTFRPPYGDIDDRVRAIGAAMGLTPVMWTGLNQDGQQILFDSEDWRVHAGGTSSTAAKAQLDRALDLAPSLNTGFIVLEHDLYQESVNLAIGSTIPNALQRGFTLQPVMTCQKKSMGEAYVETSGQAPPPGGNSTTTGGPSTGPSGSTSKSTTQTTGNIPTTTGANPSQTSAAAVVARFASGWLVVVAAAAVGLAIY